MDSVEVAEVSVEDEVVVDVDSVDAVVVTVAAVEVVVDSAVAVEAETEAVAEAAVVAVEVSRYRTTSLPARLPNSIRV